MELGAILAFLTLVLKFALQTWDVLKNTKPEERRAGLAECDKALAQAFPAAKPGEPKPKPDLREYSKWLGSRA